MSMLEELIQYSNDCISDKIISCVKHKQACQRFLNDLDKTLDDSYTYYWDEQEADRIVYFFTLLRHSTGILAGTPIYLNIWQKFIVCNIFGWRRKDNTFRRFNMAFIEVSRKNSKSQLQSGIGLFILSYESSSQNERCQCFCCGIKKEQAKVVFEESKNMLNKSPIEDRFKLNRNEIIYKKTNSFFKPLSKDDGKVGDGSNQKYLCIDEYHLAKDSSFLQQFQQGSQVKSGLCCIITTAGKDLTVPCFVEEYAYCTNILDENVDVFDENYFADILETDENDDINDIEVWKKSNPVRMTYQEGIDKIKKAYDRAILIPEQMTDFLTKSLDIWVMQKKNGYMNMKNWKKCEVKKLPIDIRGRNCFVGMDLSSTNDLTSLAFIFPFWNSVKECMQYVVFTHSFVPNYDLLRIREATDGFSYTSWVRGGYITVQNTPQISNQGVIDWAKAYIKKHDLKVRIWGYDPARSQHTGDVIELDFTAWAIMQTHNNLNETTVAFRQQVLDGNVFYLANPVMNFAMNNAMVSVRNSLIKIDKDANKFKIDPVDATICAFKPCYFTYKKEDEEEEIDIEDLIDQLNS